jgi:hypothetical protein
VQSGAGVTLNGNQRMRFCAPVSINHARAIGRNHLLCLSHTVKGLHSYCQKQEPG